MVMFSVWFDVSCFGFYINRRLFVCMIIRHSWEKEKKRQKGKRRHWRRAEREEQGGSQKWMHLQPLQSDFSSPLSVAVVFSVCTVPPAILSHLAAISTCKQRTQFLCFWLSFIKTRRSFTLQLDFSLSLSAVCFIWVHFTRLSHFLCLRLAF